jgi:hypothetical protein
MDCNWFLPSVPSTTSADTTPAGWCWVLRDGEWALVPIS